MSSITLYEYHTKSDGNDAFTVKVHPGKTGSVVLSDLSPNDQFAFNGKVFTYVGGANFGANGPEVGFFATGPNGQMHFFATTELTGKETLVLNSSQDYPLCLVAGTLVSTPRGEVPVETIAIGDEVLTSDGRSVPVRWVGVQKVTRLFANPTRVLPIRIQAGALGENLPRRDLLVSPCHALFIDGVLVQAGALVNGTTITRDVTAPSTFTYYHVELDDHSLIMAEGVPAETFIDNVDRMAFDNWDEHQRLYPEGRPVPEMSHPRVSSARQLPASIQDKLAQRAHEVLRPGRAAA